MIKTNKIRLVLASMCEAQESIFAQECENKAKTRLLGSLGYVGINAISIKKENIGVAMPIILSEGWEYSVVDFGFATEDFSVLVPLY